MPDSPLSQPLPWNLVSAAYAEMNVPHFTKYAADALALASLQPDQMVVDVACGPGSLTFLAAEKVRQVQALDFSPEMIRELEAVKLARGITNVEATVGDGQALPFGDEAFDAGFSMFGLMFFPDRSKGFAELYRVLKPGGIAVVASWKPMLEVPFLTQLMEALAAEFPEMKPGEGSGPLTDPDEFREEMSAVGFECRIEETCHTLESDDFDSFWAGLQKTFAPVVLLRHKLGEEAYAPVAERVRSKLESHYPGAMQVSMPAWLGVGRK